MIKVKRVYEKPHPGDGFRILIDRFWPRGLSKAMAGVDLWLKDIAPSDGLRKWFSHEPAKWNQFRRRYIRELRDRGDLLDGIATRARGGTVTLLYEARDRTFNHAVVLKEHLDGKRAKRA